MSKPKGLEFEASEPAFLRRMRGEIAGKVDDPDRQLNAVARPSHIAKRLEKDEDDAPTYVLEDSSATLTKEEYEALVQKSEDGGSNGKTAMETTKPEEPLKQKQRLAEIGGQKKKRKLGKIIAADGDDTENSTPGNTTTKASSKSGVADKKAAKQKKAKVNIRFGDDEDNANV